MKSAREKLLDRHALIDDPFNYLFSGSTFALWKSAAPPTRNAAVGRVLDAGSGRGGWSRFIERSGCIRESIDISPRAGNMPTWVGDLMSMPDVPSARFDAAICHQVLEHIRVPQSALSELRRVIKPGGILVISVPHLSRRHELPNDFTRYTQEGLSAILTEAGFTVISSIWYGGLLTFLHHQLSTVLLGFCSAWRPLFVVGFLLNAPISLACFLVDRLVDRSGLLANGVIAVAKTPA